MPTTTMQKPEVDQFEIERIRKMIARNRAENAEKDVELNVSNKYSVVTAEEELRIIEEQREQEWIQLRKKREAELADLKAELADLVAQAATEEKLELEKKQEALNLKKLELETLARELSSSDILKSGEKRRQEALDQLRAARKAETEAWSLKKMEMNEQRHKVEMMREERLMKLDERRQEMMREQLLRKEDVILNGIKNASNLSKSLAIEDNFEMFKQECQSLIQAHRKLSIAYDSIESELFKAHKRMKNGRPVEEVEMDELLSALRVFRETAMIFTATGSNNEEVFQMKISQVIHLAGELKTNINKVQSEIDDFEDGSQKSGKGIGEELVAISEGMMKIGVLIQQFNVIGENNLRKTLAIQMDQPRSAIAGPSRASAITHN